MADKGQEYWDEVIRAIRAGQRERFREVVLEFQDVLRFAVAYHVRRDEERIDELVQATFVRAFQSLDRFELGLPLGPWLRAIARNEALNEVRRLRRDAALSQEVIQAELMRAREGSEPPVERLVRLRGCLGNLQDKAREVVHLRYFQRRPFEEIAKALGRSAGAVRVALLQIRRSLKTCMERASS